MATVLVVEDEPDLRDMMAHLLALEGYDVCTAANGAEALTHLHESPPPALVLLDLMMPVMSGWDFLRAQARDSRLAAIPVVVVSALDGEHTRALGAVEVLRKPLELERLLEVVGACCKCAEPPGT